MRALITGGTGFIGKSLCRLLSRGGHDVFVLTRSAPEDHAMPAEKNGVTRFLQVDLLDQEAVRKTVGEVMPEIVFHLAALLSTDVQGGDVRRLFRVNTEATMSFLDACTAVSPFPRVVYASTMSVYPYEQLDCVPVDERHRTAPHDLYGLSKLMGELHCGFLATHSGLPCSILRISGVYGPGKNKGLIYNCLSAAQTGREIRLLRGDVRRDFVYVEDVAGALVSAVLAAKPGEPAVYNIGSGSGSSLMDVVAGAERVTGRPVKIVFQAETPASHFWFDIEKARQELGFRPRDLVDGMDAYWQVLAEDRKSTGEGDQP